MRTRDDVDQKSEHWRRTRLGERVGKGLVAAGECSRHYDSSLKLDVL